MKLLLLLASLISIQSSICAQHYFRGSLTLQLVHADSLINYESFIRDWKIIDEDDCIEVSVHDTNFYGNRYFDLAKDKRNFVHYSPESGLFEITLGGGNPHFSFDLLYKDEKVASFYLLASDCYADSVSTDKRQFFSNRPPSNAFPMDRNFTRRTLICGPNFPKRQKIEGTHEE